MSSATPLHVHGIRWLVVCSLLLTVPAFYVEMLESSPSLWATLDYAFAAVALGFGSRWMPHHHRRPQSHVLTALLVLGFTLSAALPPSADSLRALALRLVTALLTLGYLVWSLQHLLRRGSLPMLLALALVVLLLCGAGFWWLEPRTPTLADGLWLAFTTAATVGFGDVVPSTAASKIFSVFVVLLGYGVLSLVTAAIAAMWVESAEQAMEHEILTDLHREVRTLQDEIRALRVEQASAIGELQALRAARRADDAPPPA